MESYTCTIGKDGKRYFFKGGKRVSKNTMPDHLQRLKGVRDYPNVKKFVEEYVLPSEFEKNKKILEKDVKKFVSIMQEKGSLETKARDAIIEISHFPGYVDMGDSRWKEYVEDEVEALVDRAMQAYLQDLKE